jgi:hypothetical protein
VAPGRSKLFAGFVSNMKLPAPIRKLSLAFDWVFHLGQQVVLDSDAYLLHVQVGGVGGARCSAVGLLKMSPAVITHLVSQLKTHCTTHLHHPPEHSPPVLPQERLLHGTLGGGSPGGWRKNFYLPATADTGVIKFRSWYDEIAGGAIPWPAGTEDRVGPVLPRDVVMDR